MTRDPRPSIDAPSANRRPQASAPEEVEREAGAFSLLVEVRRHPAATMAFGVCVVAGIAIATALLPESIALPRRVVGGAIVGGLSWLLVMAGRIIGG